MTKICKSCDIEKPLSEFGNNYIELDGKSRYCRICGNKQVKEWRLKNSERHKMNVANGYRRRKPERVKKVRVQITKTAEQIANMRNKERARCALYYKKYPEKGAAKSAKRNAKKKNAIPKWFSEYDAFTIDEAYLLSKLRTVSTGFKWHVDHIVPLLSKLVCGLHTCFNIQVIPASVNIRKGNRHWPQMP